MTILKTIYAERVLIVLNADGSIKGAHQDRIETISEGDNIISQRMLGAEALEPATLAAVLPDRAALVAQVQQLADVTAERDALRAQVTSLQQSSPPPSEGVASVSPLQARKALLAAGLLAAAETAIAASGAEAQLAWEYASVIERSSPLIAGVVQALGLTDDEIDALFTQARAL